MSLAVESARQEWEESYRRLEAAARDPARYEALLDHVDAVGAELRRRVGATFTLAELARVYAGADRWSRDVVAERAEGGSWVKTLALVEGAAFHLYSRGAVDFDP